MTLTILLGQRKGWNACGERTYFKQCSENVSGNHMIHTQKEHAEHNPCKPQGKKVMFLYKKNLNPAVSCASTVLAKD